MSKQNPNSEMISVRCVTITDQDELQTRREKLARIILDEMFQFVGLLTPEGLLLEVNRAALEGGGIVLEEIQGKPFWEVHWWTISPETQRELQNAIARAAKGDFIRYDVDVYGSKSGAETITIDFSIIPIKDNDGKVVFLLPEGRDITEKVQAKYELDRKNKELQIMLEKVRSLDTLKNNFFANVSHELRTPLTLIMGPAKQILQKKEEISENQLKHVKMIYRNASMLLKQVNELMDISKIDARQMKIRYVRKNIVETLKMISGLFDVAAQDKKINLTITSPESMIVEYDVKKIERIVLNLLSNAFKFTPNHGMISIILKQDESNKFFELSVSDSGPGIPADKYQEIFERFYQIDGGATRALGGTGLGLSIVREFVELHGGTVSVGNSNWGGAKFTIKIPLSAPVNQEVFHDEIENNQEELASQYGGNLNELSTQVATIPHMPTVTNDQLPVVLIAEDNAELNNFITESLSNSFNVITTTNGEECFEVLQRILPHVLVTDIMMPKMSGEQLVYKIRSDSSFDDLPIILLSAKADTKLRIGLLKNGAQDYCIKPFNMEELSARIYNLALLHERQKNKKANARIDDIAAANARLESFAFIASHDLKSPLRAIVQLANWIEDDLKNEFRDEISEHLKLMRARVHRMENLLNDLLAYSRVGKYHESTQSVDTKKMVENIFDFMVADTSIALQFSSEMPIINTQKAPLELVFRNLIGNAIKHHDKSKGYVRISASRLLNKYEFSVEDDGPGILPEFHHQVFMLFKTLKSRDQLEGSGIGLSIVQKTVESMGGDISIKSDGLHGSVFHFTWPISC